MTTTTTRRGLQVTATLLLGLVLGACSGHLIPGLQPEHDVILDGQTCTFPGQNPPDDLPEGGERDSILLGADCEDAHDWQASHTIFDTTYQADGIVQRTRLAHRQSQPDPPIDSLFIAFEATGAAPLGQTTLVALAVGPEEDVSQARLYQIQPIEIGAPGDSAAIDRQPDLVRSFVWDEAAEVWSPDGDDPSEMDVRYAYNTALGYWGVEARLHLTSVGVTGRRIQVATFWQTETIDGQEQLVLQWQPDSANDPTSPEFPVPDPEEWIEYSLVDPEFSVFIVPEGITADDLEDLGEDDDDPDE